jgi:DNA-binding XRE family transcriptional regulator
LNPYTDKLASLLEPYLEYQCANNRGRLPWTVKVGTLLDAALDGTQKRGGGYYDLAAIRGGKREDRRDVVAQWEEAILALRDLGWTIDFDPETYPEELRPAWALEDKAEEAHRENRRKPKDYWEPLMAAKVLVSPPPGIAALYDKSRKPSKKNLLPVSLITGDQVRAAREKAGITQGQLAERLGKSRSWVTMIEGGKRNISPEDQAALARELGLGAL